MYSINDIIRQKISSMKKENIYSYLKKLDRKKRKYIINLMLSDLCKIEFYEGFFVERKNKPLIFKYDEKTLIKKFEANKKNLSLLVDSTVLFHKLDILSKMIILDEMEFSNKDEYLSNINKLHFLDKIIYKFDYNLDTIKLYYLNYLNCNKNTLISQQNASHYISLKLLDLKSINYKKYKKVMLKIIKVYYKWNLYKKNSELEKPRTKFDYDYLHNIEKDPLIKIFNDIEENYKFLNTIVSNYLYYSTIGNDNELYVDKYYRSNSDINLQKKLKIK